MRATRPALLHLHIPRTAGSSIYRALHSMYSSEETLKYGSFDRFSFEFEPANAPSLVSGHFHFGLHEYFADSVYLIILRDPVERVRSLFSYIQQTREHRLHAHFNQAGFNFEVLYRSDKAKRGVQFHNGQVRQLNYYHIRGIETLSAVHLRSAIEVLQREDVIIGFVDSLHRPMRKLSERFGVRAPDVSVTNTSPSSSIESRWDDAIRAHNQLDYELYHAARALCRT